MNIRLTKKNETKEKRKSQTCKVYEVKIDHSHLSHSAVTHFNCLFKEAKWFYNYCLSNDNVDNADTTLKKVLVKVGEQYEIRYFDALTSQMKQGIKTRLFGSLMSLAALKEQGNKVGRLKFKGVVNSIPLKQFSNSYYIRNGVNYVKNIQPINPNASYLDAVNVNDIPNELIIDKIREMI